jgi:hypothetical protein
MACRCSSERMRTRPAATGMTRGHSSLPWLAFFCGPSHANSTPTLLPPLEARAAAAAAATTTCSSKYPFLSSPPSLSLHSIRLGLWPFCTSNRPVRDAHETPLFYTSGTSVHARIHLNQCTYRSIGPSMLTINQHDILCTSSTHQIRDR